MPAPAARVGDRIITGHPCSGTSTIAVSLQAKVRVAGLTPGSVSGSIIAPHTILVGDSCVPHAATTGFGSPKVFYGGLPANRVGDNADMGVIISGAPNVIIGP